MQGPPNDNRPFGDATLGREIALTLARLTCAGFQVRRHRLLREDDVDGGGEVFVRPGGLEPGTNHEVRFPEIASYFMLATASRRAARQATHVAAHHLGSRQSSYIELTRAGFNFSSHSRPPRSFFRRLLYPLLQIRRGRGESRQALRACEE